MGPEDSIRVKIRNATRDDCTAISMHAYLAGKAQLDLSASDFLIPGEPGPTEERLKVIQTMLRTESVGWFHYTHYLVAEVDGDVEGSLCAFSERDGPLDSIHLALFELGWTEHDIQAADQRMAPFNIVDFVIPPDQFHIETIAVSPGFRRRGIATRLLEHAIGEARRESFNTAYLTVLIGNLEAQRAYEKFGFEVIEEKRDPIFEDATGCPGKALMCLTL